MGVRHGGHFLYTNTGVHRAGARQDGSNITAQYSAAHTAKNYHPLWLMGSLYSGAVVAQLHPIWKHEQFNRVCICQWGTHPKHGIVLGPGKAETKDERCSSWAAVMISRWVYVAWEICKEHWRRTGERRHFPQVLYISSLYKLQTSLHSTHWLIIFLVSTFILSQSVVAIMQVHRIGMCNQLFIVQN